MWSNPSPRGCWVAQHFSLASHQHGKSSQVLPSKITQQACYQPYIVKQYEICKEHWTNIVRMSIPFNCVGIGSGAYLVARYRRLSQIDSKCHHRPISDRSRFPHRGRILGQGLSADPVQGRPWAQSSFALASRARDYTSERSLCGRSVQPQETKCSHPQSLAQTAIQPTPLRGWVRSLPGKHFLN